MSQCTCRLFVVIVSSTLCVTLTACPGSEEDNSIQTCVDDLSLDVESRSTIQELHHHYEDFPTHCRYGQCLSDQYVCVLIVIPSADGIKY